ncbi:JAB domain-containing protein [uncultured Lutibacter sp.]|uniref:JAB domain-containing protein n=1 Tax=uncultured Lutibacter sp. TaxID=437739 RepID=UPI00260BFAD3|nr:JAB domain-containing protein [uncultured Lutibacter sp.]
MKNIISEIKLKYQPTKLEKKKIRKSDDAYNIALKHWDLDTIELQEEFKVLLLNNSNEVIGIYEMTKGGINSTLVDLKLMFAVVLKSCASGIITVHNHPSGKLKPSTCDISIYNRIKKACKFLEIHYLDNLIISREGKYSFADENV